MPMPTKTASLTAASLAAALVVLLGTSLSTGAEAASPAKPVHQLMKPMPPTGPGRPTGLQNKAAGSGRNAAGEGYGCHDNVSQTSYEGPCNYYPEYEATGGCESEATGTSYPGNCQNSSEP